jgi:hypothetical protein
LRKRPNAVHFICIESEEWLAIKASMTTSEVNLWSLNSPSLFLAPSIPLKGIGLLKSQIFQIKIQGLDSENYNLFSKVFQSDKRGNFDLKIFKSSWRGDLVRIVVFEVGLYEGVEMLIGHFIPLKIYPPKKLLISDFDKTLVDTRYSTTKEMYYSLTRPVSSFPTVQESVHLFKQTVSHDFHPFILSASPHFYEGAIRDWLYQNGVYTAGIFLKDYRTIFSPFDGQLTPKDLKSQGAYKLGALIHLLLMTGIPHELVLMGDGMESDALIYLSFWMLLRKKISPWDLWNMIKKEKPFALSVYQNAMLLNKMYQLDSLIQQQKNVSCHVKIYIRCLSMNTLPLLQVPAIKKYEHMIHYYEGKTHES